MDPLKKYFLLKIVIFQPAMLVYQRVTHKNQLEIFEYCDGLRFRQASQDADW